MPAIRFIAEAHPLTYSLRLPRPYRRRALAAATVGHRSYALKIHFERASQRCPAHPSDEPAIPCAQNGQLRTGPSIFAQTQRPFRTGQRLRLTGIVPNPLNQTRLMLTI